MDYFNKTYHPPGTPPGTLVASTDARMGDVVIRLIDYTEHEVQEIAISHVNECQPFLERESVTWIHLQGHINPQMIEALGGVYKLHPLALEDVLNRGQRPKLDDYDDSLFVSMNIPVLSENAVETNQVSLFLGDGFVFSFYAGANDPFELLRKRIRKQGSRIRKQKADYLFYGMLDLIVDQGYPVLEKLGDQLEDIEELLLSGNVTEEILTDIHHLRRELLLLRRNLWPQREVINKLLRNENKLIEQDSLIYFSDCYDHTIQIIELIENYREIATNILDVYLSAASHRLSEVMRVLTLIATIFIPLTFVVGVYGMNFNHSTSPWAMPELHWYYGYPLVWLVMIVIVIFMLVYFKRKRWV
jgi:magnesium transporter